MLAERRERGRETETEGGGQTSETRRDRKTVFLSASWSGLSQTGVLSLGDSLLQGEGTHWTEEERGERAELGGRELLLAALAFLFGVLITSGDSGLLAAAKLESFFGVSRITADTNSSHFLLKGRLDC